MKRHVLPRVLMTALAGGLCYVGVTLLPTHVEGQEAKQKVAVAVQAEQGEVLTRGPIHEAFATPVDLNPTKGVVVAKEPPDAIEELAPEQKPAGDNVAWISGYWAWDDERDDFFWLSGTWRVIPSGVQWIPGYWVSVDNGYQWVSGMWVKADAELAYLPEPPATQEAGPSSAAPSADHFWVPGSSVWRDGRYVWRAGYWQRAYQGWVWTPSRYVWTPQGYLYTAGYWDYDVSARGMLFAPVYFNRGVYSRAGFTYSPSIAMNMALLTANLFVRPQYRHYYFGDYYGNTYATAGYTPWIRYSSSRNSYDPFFSYARWRYRDDRGWFERMERDFDGRVRNADSRPPRTFAEVSARAGAADSPVIAASLKDFARISSKESRIELEAVSKEGREETSKVSAELAKLRKERQQFDARGATAKKGEKSEPVKFEISKSPVVSSSKAADRQPPRSDDEPEKTVKKDPTKSGVKEDPTKKEPPKVDPPKRDPLDPPKKDPPKVDPPKRDPLDPPKKDPPKVDPPKRDPPKVDPPKVDPPKVNPPKVDPPKGNPPKVDPPKKNPPKVDPPKANPPSPIDPPKKVDPPKVDPPKKDVPKKDVPKKDDQKDDDKKGAAMGPLDGPVV